MLCTRCRCESDLNPAKPEKKKGKKNTKNGDSVAHCTRSAGEGWPDDFSCKKIRFDISRDTWLSFIHRLSYGPALEYRFAF